ncbi:MAG TPA: lanthionine synthetase LanC family protein [Dermatophilaceae bacterium]
MDDRVPWDVEQAVEACYGHTVTFDGSWISLPGAAIPTQGWKLHISATLPDALPVLARALPVLRAENVTAKVAGSLAMLAELNEGWLGPSQIGKLLTVYPVDDHEAVALADLLDGATTGLRGPSVPSDRPLRPGSLVHYRYGAFVDRPMRTPLGELVTAIGTPDGTLVPDPRDTVYRQPDWVEDPFLSSGVASPSPPRKLLVAGRYLTVATLHRSARGAVYLAIDLSEGRRCVVKRAAPNATARWDGQDAHGLLRHEHAVLRRLRSSDAFPAALELVSDGDELYLAMEDVPGQTLTEAAREVPAEKRAQQICRWGARLARALDLVHQQGYVHGDVKPANVVVTPAGVVRVVDFDLAFELDGTRAASGAGSLGYQSPQRSMRVAPATSDDVWALGATLTAALTGLPLPLVGDSSRLAALPGAAFPPRTPELLRATLARCLSPESVDRWPSMGAVAEALDRVSLVLNNTPERRRDVPSAFPEANEPFVRARSASLARRTADGLVASSLRHGDDDAPASLGPGARAWRSTLIQSQHGLSADLNAGAAGAVLALAEVVDRFRDARHIQALTSASMFLLDPPRPPGYVAPGLWVGEAGRGAALLRAGQVLGDATLIAAATDVAREVAALPHVSPDFYNGSAGRLLFHLLLWDETQDDGQLTAALRAALAIEDRAVGDATGVRWTFPDGFADLSGDSRTLGYAHGVAGIGDSLLDMADVTGDQRWLDLAAGAVRSLEVETIEVGGEGGATSDAPALAWPRVAGGTLNRPAWCHGAVGIGRFLLRASGAGIPGAARLARGAASSAVGADAALAGQCHGAAGVIELLLDLYQADGRPAHLEAARRLESAVDVYSFTDGEALHWVGEIPGRGAFEYAVGSSGLIPCLLRLADPERRPYQLSREGFRWREEPAKPSGTPTLLSSGSPA